jgi:hypothetical protein
MVFRLLALGCLLMSLASCFQPQEGCTDIEATNYDVNADKDCEKPCCTYPALKIDLKQLYDTLNFVEGVTYVNDQGQPFKLRSVSFYLSEFQLFKSSSAFSVSDTVSMLTFAASGQDSVRELFTDDFMLIRRNSTGLSVGSFRTSGVYESFQCRLGLGNTARRVIAAAAPTGHPLQIQADSLWHGKDQGYVFLQVVVSDTTANAALDTFSLKQSDIGDLKILSSGLNFTQKPGFDLTISMEADFKKMLNGVDWSSGDKSVQKSRIALNLPGVFRVVQ